jgi:hypothetical protein
MTLEESIWFEVWKNEYLRESGESFGEYFKDPGDTPAWKLRDQQVDTSAYRAAVRADGAINMIEYREQEKEVNKARKSVRPQAASKRIRGTS